MSGLDPLRDTPPDATADAPNQGAVVLVVDGQERIILTEALHWTEGGEHVIASTEFQVSAAAPTFAEAYTDLIDNLLEEAQALMGLIHDAKAAPNERDEALELFSRLQRIVQAEERLANRAARKRSRLRPRRTVETVVRSRRWQARPQAPHPSARPSLV